MIYLVLSFVDWSAIWARLSWDVFCSNLNSFMLILSWMALFLKSIGYQQRLWGHLSHRHPAGCPRPAPWELSRAPRVRSMKSLLRGKFKTDRIHFFQIFLAKQATSFTQFKGQGKRHHLFIAGATKLHCKGSWI